MAVIYLRSSDGSDASDGLTWAEAKATLAAALTAAGNGGTVYVSKNHAESAAVTKVNQGGTAASPRIILCVDDTGDPEPPTALSTGATVTSTPNPSGVDFRGFGYCYGVTFITTSGDNAIAFGGDQLPWSWRLEACSLQVAAGGADILRVGIHFGQSSDDAQLELINTKIKSGDTNKSIRVYSRLRWLNTGTILESGSSVPTTLFSGANPLEFMLECRGIDLSQFGSGKTLIGANLAVTGYALLDNCKLAASVTLSGAPVGPGGIEVDVVNCDSGNSNYRYYRRRYAGEIFQESTIVRTGGASDGTTPISRKMVTSANSKWYFPLVSREIDVWLEATGAYTGTVEIVTDGVTLTDAEAWLEVEYLGTSGFPISSFAHDRASNFLSTPANQTTSSVDWTTTGLSSPTKQQLSVSFTTAMKGWARFKVYLAKASTTMYFDPEINDLGFISGRQWQGASYINEGAAGGSRISASLSGGAL